MPEFATGRASGGRTIDADAALAGARWGCSRDALVDTRAEIPGEIGTIRLFSGRQPAESLLAPPDPVYGKSRQTNYKRKSHQ